MAFLVFTIISTFLGQALNGKRCRAVAPKLDKMSTIAVITSQYHQNDLREHRSLDFVHFALKM